MVLVVDDMPEVLSLIHSLLSQTYQIKSVNSGKKAFRLPRPTHSLT
jgi:CheY-like chemotaxis protein